MTDTNEFRLRDATIADVPALAALHVRTFRETHGGGPTAAVREQQWRAKFDSGQLVFCVLIENRAGEPIGFASGQLHKDEPHDYEGELNKVYVLREYHRRGLGRRLLCAAAQRFAERGITSMLLFGDAKSPSNAFYEAMGGQRLCAPNGEFFGAYGWPDVSVIRSLSAAP